MPDTPPDNVSYLILALGSVFVIMGGFVVSLFARYRNLQQDIEVIEQLREE